MKTIKKILKIISDFFSVDNEFDEKYFSGYYNPGKDLLITVEKIVISTEKYNKIISSLNKEKESYLKRFFDSIGELKVVKKCKKIKFCRINTYRIFKFLHL